MNLTKKACVLMALLLTGTAQADTSAVVGLSSDYYYRGIFQAPNSINVGLDFEQGGFYVGSWAADVKDGLEVDGYFGFNGTAGDIAYSVGYTGYFYTGGFDDTYQELNLGTSYGLISVDVALGRYDNFDGPTLDYSYYSLTVAKQGFYGKYAGFAQDFAGEYVEVGFGTSIANLDVGIAAIFANKELAGNRDESLILSIAKSFDLQ
jgi:uncharacterized protein (TIGR02001 family)